MENNHFDNFKQYSDISGIGVQIISHDGDNVYATEQYYQAFSAVEYIDNLMEDDLKMQTKAAIITGAFQSYRFGGRFFFYSPIGLFHFASPIITKGKHVMTAIGGPILVVTVDEYINLDLEGKINGYHDTEKLKQKLELIPYVKADIANTLSEQLLINAKHVSDNAYLGLDDQGRNKKYSEYVLAYFSDTPSYSSILQMAEEKRKQTPAQKHKQIIDEVLDYISNNCSQKITLENVAAKVFISPSYLSRIIKEQTEKSFRYHVNTTRVSKCIKLFENEHLSLNEIALSIGFEDHSYFTKVFKKHTGMRPSEYRKMLLTKNENPSFEE